jgi:fumarate reductase flavoprotein subunit
MEESYDVIIVGGGGGGMAAAIEANERGASVLILEADKKLGGATKLSGGVFYAAGTSVQRDAGIQDTADAMYTYIMTLSAWQTRPDLIRLMSDQSGPALEWLIGLGAKYNPEWTVCSGVDTVPRGHPTVGAGESLARVLEDEVGGRGIDTVLNTRVDSLIIEQDRVVGVRASGVELRARSVILTTGGFGNSPGMRARYFPSAAQHGNRVFAVHDDAPFILGDGIELGEQAGAAIVGHDTGLVLPSAGLGKFIEAFLPPWTMLVNEQGQRFMPESAPYAVSGYLINEQTHARSFAIFDEPTLVEASADKRFADPYNTGHTTMTWDEEMIRRFATKGKIKTARTIEALAAAVNIDSVALVNTVRRYNDNVSHGADRDYFKKAPKLFPIASPPFYAVEVRASIIGQTSAGLDIDASTNVRDVHGRTIPGLFAAGEVLGCVQGHRYAGGGMGVGSAIIFGRIAGAAAAIAAGRNTRQNSERVVEHAR